MDAEVLKIVGQVAGFGGLALGVFFLLFKDLLKKVVAPQMTPEHWFKVVVIFMILVWSIAVLGIGAWVYGGTRDPSGTRGPNPTDPFVIYTMRSNVNAGGYTLDSFSFPYRDIQQHKDYRLFSSVVLNGLPPYKGRSVTDLVVFRMNDEVIVDSLRHADLVSGGNMAVLVIPQSIINEFGNTHYAFTYAKSALDRIK
jgi:hypothetical protein